MNLFLDTAPVNTFRPETSRDSELTSFADILTHSTLATAFSAAPCSVCVANDLPTVGPTYHDPETNGHFCLGCLELACEPLEDGPEELEFEDPEIVAYAVEWIASHRAA